MKESPAESLLLGVSHVDKIGKLVILDVNETGESTRCGVRGGVMESVGSRVILSGILHGTQDNYGSGGDVESTSMIIGDATLIIRWGDAPDEMNATISVLVDD